MNTQSKFNKILETHNPIEIHIFLCLENLMDIYFQTKISTPKDVTITSSLHQFDSQLLGPPPHRKLNGNQLFPNRKQSQQPNYNAQLPLQLPLLDCNHVQVPKALRIRASARSSSSHNLVDNFYLSVPLLCINHQPGGLGLLLLGLSYAGDREYDLSRLCFLS